MIIPYIGIIGFRHASEVQALAPLFRKIRHRQLMVGVSIGQTRFSSHQSPPVETISEIFDASTIDCLNMVHYQTSEPTTLAAQIVLVTDVIGDRLEGFQLNVPMPNPNVVDMLAIVGMTMAIRIDGKTMHVFKGEPMTLVNVIKREYKKSLTYVVFTGMNASLDIDLIAHYIEAFKKHAPQYNLVFSGQLTPDNLALIKPLFPIVPSLSISADYSLCDPHTGALDLERAQAFIRKSAELSSALT